VATHGAPAAIAQLDVDVSAQGYVSSFSFSNPEITPADAAFWAGSRSVANIGGVGNDVEYVIHRFCTLKQPFSFAGNRCITSNFEPGGNGNLINASLGTGNEEVLITVPLVHYLITARVINAQKSTTIINQLTVMMGA
jgi:hypothetical protein